MWRNIEACATKPLPGTSAAFQAAGSIQRLPDRIQARVGTMEVAGLVAKIIREDKPNKVNIDVGGLGVGVYDRLIEQGYGNVVYAVISRQAG
jgi:hypothetical protein